MQVVRLERPRQAVAGVAPDPRPDVEEHPERERPRDAVHHARRDRVVEAEAERQPAAGAPAPGGVEDPHDGAEQAGENEVRLIRARSMIAPDRIEAVVHEKRRNARKKIRLMLFVRFGPDASLHGMPPWHATRGEVAAVRADRQTGLVAVVDPPPEVVEGRRHDRDREDVLHRRRHHVLAARDAGLVRHEARVDQPHQDDGEEVELLAEDLRARTNPSVSSSSYPSSPLSRRRDAAVPRAPPASSGPTGGVARTPRSSANRLSSQDRCRGGLAGSCPPSRPGVRHTSRCENVGAVPIAAPVARRVYVAAR